MGFEPTTLCSLGECSTNVSTIAIQTMISCKINKLNLLLVATYTKAAIHGATSRIGRTIARKSAENLNSRTQRIRSASADKIIQLNILYQDIYL